MHFIDTRVRSVIKALTDAGGDVHLVGGFVRDMCLGIQPKDFDMEVFGMSVDEIDQVLSKFGPVDRIGRRFGVLNVRVNGVDIQVTPPRRENKVGAGHKGFVMEPDPTMTHIEASARRDFTINSMFFEPFTGLIIDPWEGREDLQNHILRHTSDHFAEDPCRVLRGMQFAGRYDLKIAPETAEMCRQMISEYETLPVEAVWSEWEKWASKSVKPSQGLEVLRRTGWVSLYQQLESLIGLPQTRAHHPEGDAWDHTLCTVDAAVQIADREEITGDDRVVLVFAALCHDFGKRYTTVCYPDGRVTTFGHDQAGKEPTETFLHSIGAPMSIIERVVPLVANHMRHIRTSDMNRRSVMRIAESVAPASIQMLAWVMEADHSGRPPLPGGMPEKTRQMVEIAQSVQAAETPVPPILMGRHLIQVFHMIPGPAMGRVLREARQAQLDDEFQDLPGAILWARQRLEE